MEAWIEILVSHSWYLLIPSPPSWRRGLKSFITYEPIIANWVASFMEAWIEIILSVSYFNLFSSPPSWRRGLKSLCWQNALYHIVASFMEAWIEIRLLATSTLCLYAVASFMEAWIEIGMNFDTAMSQGRLLHGGVD